MTRIVWTVLRLRGERCASNLDNLVKAVPGTTSSSTRNRDLFSLLEGSKEETGTTIPGCVVNLAVECLAHHLVEEAEGGAGPRVLIGTTGDLDTPAYERQYSSDLTEEDQTETYVGIYNCSWELSATKRV